MSKAQDLVKAQEDLQAQVKETSIVALHGNLNLVRLLSIWHLVPIRQQRKKAAPPGKTAPLSARRDWLWEHFVVDHEFIRAALGANFPAEAVVRQAICQGLVNPDGTIYYRAEQYLGAAAADIIQSFASVRQSQKGRTGKASD